MDEQAALCAFSYGAVRALHPDKSPPEHPPRPLEVKIELVLIVEIDFILTKLKLILSKSFGVFFKPIFEFERSIVKNLFYRIK